MIWKGPADRRVIALTFDDGPGMPGTADLLDVLEKYGVKATFFVIGGEAEINPDEVFRIHDAGHEVANHSFSHLRLDTVAANKGLSDIGEAEEIIVSITGEKPRFFRPPGGKIPAAVSAALEAQGYRIIGWTINAEDFTEFSEEFELENNYAEIAEGLRAKVIKQAQPGAIVLMHNGSKQTVLALPGIIEELRRRGYGFVTVSELLEGEK